MKSKRPSCYWFQSKDKGLAQQYKIQTPILQASYRDAILLSIYSLADSVIYQYLSIGSFQETHYCDVMMGAVASQITSLTIVYSTVYSNVDQSKHQSSASLAFVWGLHRGPVNFPHKWPVTRKMFPFDDVIMFCSAVTPEFASPLCRWIPDTVSR